MLKTRRSRNCACRRGLAPVELVVSIPVLMFAVGLSVIFGVATCWKVRAEVAARDAVFASRWPRRGVLPSAPEFPLLPPNSHRGVGGERDLFEIAFTFENDELIRGPLPNGLQVDNSLLDLTNHARAGVSHLLRSPPALASHIRPYSFDIRQPLLDGKWQYWQLGYASNTSRRLRRLYDILNLPGASGKRAVYQQAQQQAFNIYMQPPYYVLDRDDEFIAWRGLPPNFYPHLTRGCSLDLDAVRLQVELHIPRIDSIPQPSNPPRYDPPGVPMNMTNAFLGLYRQQLNFLKAQKNPTPAQQARMQQLQALIDLLEDYKAYLNSLN